MQTQWTRKIYFHKLMLKSTVPLEISQLSKSPMSVLTQKTHLPLSSELITFYIIFLKYPPNAHSRNSKFPPELFKYELCWLYQLCSWVEFLWRSEEKASVSRVQHYLDLAGWAPESLLRSVAKNAGCEGLITEASNPDSNLQKYGEVQKKSWKWFATFCSNRSHE